VPVISRECSCIQQQEIWIINRGILVHEQKFRQKT
jgi:hypothetical protein